MTIMNEIVGESGTADGEGCLTEVLSVGVALAMLGGLVWGLAAWLG